MGRICFLRYGNELIIDSLAAGFQKLGNETSTVVISPQSTFDEVKSQIEACRPDACLTHNFYALEKFGPEDNALEVYLADKQIPTLAWFFDSPMAAGARMTNSRFLFGNISPNILNVLTDSEQFDFLKSRKILSDFLPLGVADEVIKWGDEFVKHHQPASKYELSFVGLPAAFQLDHSLQNEEDMRAYYQGSILNQILQSIQFEASSVDRMQEVADFLKSCLSDFFSKVYTSCEDYEFAKTMFLARVKATLGMNVSAQLFVYFGRVDFLYSWYQLNLYLYRLQEFDLHVFGGEQWSKGLLPGYQRPSPRLSFDELLQTFFFSKINFALTKWHFRKMIQERVFLAYGCGGFFITDWRSDLPYAFERDEVVAYKTIDEAKDLIRYYQKNESERLKILEKGRARVRRDHTYSKRASSLAKMLNQHFGLSFQA